jgi:NAD(P)-dependent dehydrogenase (short-subunit alcohol dehydrogenase family)
MNALAGRVIALDADASRLAQTVSNALVEMGAQVLSITGDPRAFAESHPDIHTLMLFLPMGQVTPIADLSDDTWEQTVNATLTRYVRLIKAVGKNMLSRRQGLILLVGGLSGLTGFPGWTASSALEGALIALTRSLACEWASQQVRLVYLACGSLEGEAALPIGDYVAASNAVERTPLKRAATADEITRTILYLVSDRASFFTGSVIRVDGGWTAWGLLK